MFFLVIVVDPETQIELFVIHQNKFILNYHEEKRTI